MVFALYRKSRNFAPRNIKQNVKRDISLMAERLSLGKSRDGQTVTRTIINSRCKVNRSIVTLAPAGTKSQTIKYQNYL